jgi:hypothetical protein
MKTHFAEYCARELFDKIVDVINTAVEKDGADPGAVMAALGNATEFWLTQMDDLEFALQTYREEVSKIIATARKNKPSAQMNPH